MYFPSIDHYRDENSIHKALNSYRVNGKEFFEISIEEAINILKPLPDLLNLQSIFKSNQNVNRFKSNQHLNRPECFGNPKHLLVRDIPGKCHNCQDKKSCDEIQKKVYAEKLRMKTEKLKSNGPSCFGKYFAYRDIPSKHAICEHCHYWRECMRI